MRKAIRDKPRGLVWELTTRLEDCYFADDIALLTHTQKDIQEKRDKVDTTARSVGLTIHPNKTKIMKMKNRSRIKLEKIQDFKLKGGRCLRRILKSRWEQHVTNLETYRHTYINSITVEVKQICWRWLGYVLRLGRTRHPLAALRWAPPWKRKRGRPLGTWRMTVEEKMKAAGKTWNEIGWLAQDCDGRERFVGALCSTWSEEE
ncbi:uncharacterized protein LOC144343190 [Saccoglossus kowalevskii]